MKTNLSNGRAESERSPWCVFVAFDDLKARQLASAVCDSLAEQFWPDIEFELHWSEFGQLEHGEEFNRALNTATPARLLIIATSAERHLPAATLKWMEELRVRRHGIEGALIGLVGCEAANAMRENIEDQLRQFAHHAGLDYLTHAPDCRTLTLPDETEWVSARAGELGSVLGSILNKPVRPQRLQPGRR